MKSYFIFPLAFVLLLTFSCSGEYDLSKVDRNVCIGGEQFVFPLGVSSRMVPDSILTLSGIDELEKDDDGHYFFHYSGFLSQSVSFNSLADKLSLPVQSRGIKTQKGTLPVLTDSEIGMLDFPLEFKISDVDSFEFSYDLSSAYRDGLIRLDSVMFKQAGFSVYGTVSGVSPVPECDLVASIKLPGRFIFNDPRMQEGRILVCDTVISRTGDVRYDPVSFSMADMSDIMTGQYSDTIEFKTLSVIIPDAQVYKSLMGHELSVDLNVKMAGLDGGSIKPDVVYCLVDRDSDPVNETIEISGIPDYMRNAVIDVEAPLLGLNLLTNATVPLKLDASMSSYYGLEETETAEASLLTPFTVDPEQPVDSSYVLANQEISVPGCGFIKTDLSSLVRIIPDAILLSVNPSTYYDRENPSSAQHVIHLSSDAEAEIAYDFSLPLLFGKDLLMEFRDTVTNMPEMLGEVLTKCDISLVGEAASSLPMDIVLQINFLDSMGNSLGMESSEAVIKGASQPGSTVVNPYSVDVKKSSDAKKISALELILFFKDGHSFCLSDSDYLQLTIQASVPGGIEMKIDKD